jgi:predicted nicotinamide N-methyase
MGEDEETQTVARLRAQIGAKFPLVTAEIRIGDRLWKVTAVQNQDALLDGADELEHFPYGFLLWESAIGLARHLAAHPGLVQGKRVLELGAGVGLPGLVARSLGAEVHQTDHQPGALSLIRVNAADNGLPIPQTFIADWREWTHPTRYDVVLGADILYERAMHFYLDTLFPRCLTPTGKLLISDPGRPQALEFVAKQESAGWNFAIETQSVTLIENGRAGRPIDVALITGQPPRLRSTSLE